MHLGVSEISWHRRETLLVQTEQGLMRVGSNNDEASFGEGVWWTLFACQAMEASARHPVFIFDPTRINSGQALRDFGRGFVSSWGLHPLPRRRPWQSAGSGLEAQGRGAEGTKKARHNSG